LRKNAMSLKAKIRNIANDKNISAQVVLQNYMFERFLERLSLSEYRDKFIIKGGILIAAHVGISNRSTMDLDATIKNYEVNTKSIEKAVKEISKIQLDDNVEFIYRGTSSIREDDEYGGLRISVEAIYYTIITPLQIDITTGDVITPKEVILPYKMIFDDKDIEVLAYNIESVLAEKVETIIRRGQYSTRPRDFYDIYILSKIKKYNKNIFSEALIKTAEHRKTEYIFNGLEKRVGNIERSIELEKRWIKYTKDYPYSKGISYESIIKKLKELLEL